MTPNVKYIAIGIVAGIAIVGCIAAITDTGTQGRFVSISSAEATYDTLILDTQTGTVNKYDTSHGVGAIAPTEVFVFQAQ